MVSHMRRYGLPKRMPEEVPLVFAVHANAELAKVRIFSSYADGICITWKEALGNIESKMRSDSGKRRSKRSAEFVRVINRNMMFLAEATGHPTGDPGWRANLEKRLHKHLSPEILKKVQDLIERSKRKTGNDRGADFQYLIKPQRRNSPWSGPPLEILDYREFAAIRT
jgi:hypothetical protein